MLARAARSGSVNCREKQLWLKCREDDEISFNNKGEKKKEREKVEGERKCEKVRESREPNKQRESILMHSSKSDQCIAERLDN